MPQQPDAPATGDIDLTQSVAGEEDPGAWMEAPVDPTTVPHPRLPQGTLPQTEVVPNAKPTDAKDPCGSACTGQARPAS